MPMRHRIILGLALLSPLLCIAQATDSGRPETFAKEFVDAVNSKSTEHRLSLLHPKSRVCINAQTQPYYDWIFSHQLRHTIPATAYKIATEPLSGEQTPASDGKSDYPLRPTHRLQIDFETGPYSSTSIILLIVRDGARWREVLPCPRPETMPGIRAAEAGGAEQERRVQSLDAKLTDPLRAEIIALARKGQRIDAIKKYRDATGEDLSTAKSVVDLLVPRERQAE